MFVDSRDRVWAGTSRGLSLFHPDADIQAPRAEINADQNILEAPPGGRVPLVFSGMDKWKATSAERLLFSWQIDGGPWSSFASGTSVALEKLRPGEHKFGVRAMDRRGNIDTSPTTYQFSVLPSWYQTTGFRYVAGISALVTGLLLAFGISNHRLLGRKKRLEHDRQEILEMVARREPLPAILQRVVWTIAANQKGAIGAALQYSDSVLQFLAFSAHSVRLAHVRGRWVDGKEGAQRDLSFWGLEHGPTIQICSGQQEILGAMVAILPRAARKTQVDTAMLQSMSGIASAAIENARLYDQLAHGAHHDVLTGLPNRLLIESELKTALAETRDRGESVALLFMDLDRFKHVNDSLGHNAGDELLGQIAARLLESIPDGAMAARIGGDEFMVVLKKQRDTSVAEETAIRILEALRKPLTIAGNDLYTSASIGISMFPNDAADAVTLQQHADLAMYRAKSRGKSRYEFFSQEIDASASKSMAMEQVLRKALEEEWLELYYQAQFNSLGELVGMEALVRLHHPLFGLVGPSDFIAVAEETGLIHSLGEWVLKQACRQIRRWQAAGLDPVKIAVNVSPLQFCQPTFAATVGQILHEMQIDPRLIELELTESMIMQDYQETALHMEKLRSLGVSIAVDDFGTGYCSLAHLHRLPIDVLKIDQSFVREMDSRSSTWSLVQAIVGLAHNLNLSVVAEGVENDCQRSALGEIDCDSLQGYVLHRPQPAKEIEVWLIPVPTHLPSPVAG